jgi:hypothetical protein
MPAKIKHFKDKPCILILANKASYRTYYKTYRFVLYVLTDMSKNST